NTTSYDDGAFWLLIEPTETIKYAGVFGLAIVLAGYVYILLKLTLWQARDQPLTDSSVRANYTAECTLDSLKATLHQAISEIATDQRRTFVTKSAANFVLNLVSEATMARKFLNVGIRIVDFAFQLLLLVQSLENGYPLVLIYALTTVIVLNSVTCVLVMCLSKFQSGFLQVLADCFFALLIAIGFPMLVLVYCLTTFDFDRKKFAINEAIFSPARYECLARVAANPVTVANVLNSLNSLRIQSVSSFFSRVGTNLSLVFQFTTLVTRRHQLKQTNLSLYPHRHPLALLFVLLPIAVVAYVSKSVGSSGAACAPHPECVVHVFRWINLREGDKTQCPCLTLVDENVAPRTYAEWQQPQDAMEKVAQLASSGDLRTVQLASRRLPTLPDELRRCKNLKHLSLMYTHTETMPSWAKEFTTLEFLHLEGALDIASLRSLPVDLFDDMSSLSYLQIAAHPHLGQLPSFRGLMNLRSLQLVLLVELEELPELTSLTKVERLTAAILFTLDAVPDMSPLRNLVGLIMLENGGVCCNGFPDDQCNPSKRACSHDPAWNIPPVTCLPANRTDKIATDATRSLFAKFPYTSCSDFNPLPVLKEEQMVLEADVTSCNGTLYRQCTMSNGSPGMCYSLRMMPIACASNISPIAMRKQQIIEK
ncbi:hypothetical protein Gpo141_00014179, partial [Globisporangium polare]